MRAFVNTVRCTQKFWSLLERVLRFAARKNTRTNNNEMNCFCFALFAIVVLFDIATAQTVVLDDNYEQ